MRAKLPRRDFWAIPLQLDARGSHLPLETCSEVDPRAPPVDHRPHFDSAKRRALERRRDLATRCIVGENVGLEPDLVLRGIDRALQSREVLGPVAQQRELVPGLEAIHVELVVHYRCLAARWRSRSNVAASAA